MDGEMRGYEWKIVEGDGWLHGGDVWRSKGKEWKRDTGR